MNFLSRQHFDILKGIAIMAVLICHIGGYSGITWFTPLGGIGVAIFLFCSGYGLSCSYEKTGLKNYWKKKVIGVYSTYFLIEVVTAIVFARNIKTIVLDLLLIKPVYRYGWYMPYLLGCYFVFWLVFKFIKQEKWKLFVLITLAVLSFFLFNPLRGEQAFSFVFGIMAAKLINKKDSPFKYGKTIHLFILTLSVVLLAIKQIPIVREQSPYILTALDLFIKTFAAASIIYFTFAVKFINKICYRVFPFFGKISYSLYLIHGYLIFIISNNLLNNYLINSFVFAILSVIVAYGVNLITKKLSTLLYAICHIT